MRLNHALHRALGVAAIVVSLVTMVHAQGVATAQSLKPGKYDIILDPADKTQVMGFVAIPEVWGEIFSPPQDLRRGLIHLKDAINRWTEITATVDNQVFLASEDILDYPFIYISTIDNFDLSPGERKNLRTYVENGGFVVIENAAPGPELSAGGAALKQMIRDTFENVRFEPIPVSDPIYHVFFDFNDGPPQGAELDQSLGLSIPRSVLYLEGYWHEGRLAVVYSDKGYIKRWNQDTDNDAQLRMGINLVIYAMQQRWMFDLYK